LGLRREVQASATQGAAIVDAVRRLRHARRERDKWCGSSIDRRPDRAGWIPTFLREYEKVARQCTTEGVDHVRYLLRLVELELIERERRTVERRIKEARFPAVKSLDSFDFQALPSLNKLLVLELARSEYVARRENIIAVGNSGTGKTHIALGLGLAACQKGLSVGFVTAAALVHELIEARDEKRLLRLQASWRDTSCSSSTNSAMCRCRKPEPSCCSRSSATAMSEARRS